MASGCNLQQNVEKESGVGKYSAVMNYFLKFVIPALLVVGLVNVLFREPGNDTPSDIIRKGYLAKNYAVVVDEYCGNNGKTMIRSTPSAFSSFNPFFIEGLP